eukprot:CAMPEP_0173390314 /NCGR_PEP_ID=MMETSP1356-20130122/14416_1 /TAXON_ID=77927 ORGANISM="Hemiselmis virescens, Strain PCC157" /NCGR_SAMPLE_ID=MMETSP1356 /ASSEMBLY_ACC=CAM_ASM_000847 /LENGTH=287 /DNA_ID=CAMNT_0014347663 /DNA_START=222 /DNA_END=1081 /DNA_ORIENTATION=+
MSADHDVWSKQNVSFGNLEQGRAALQDTELLNPFYDAWTACLDRLDASPLAANTSLARQLPSHGVNALMIGEAGAGKSTLVKVLTGDEGIITSATQAGTHGDTRYKCPCGLNWIDTPGFKLPVSPEEATNRNQSQSVLSKWKDDFVWARWLKRINGFMTSSDLSVRPSVVVYCHRASSRIIPPRLLDMWRIPKAHNVPLIVCMTDVCGVDDSALRDVRKSMAGMLEDLGADPIGRFASLIEINSEQKTVRGHQYKVTGVKQLLEGVMNSLHPQHSMQLCSRPWIGMG